MFLTTHWSLIEDTGGSDGDKNGVLIELLLKKYWKPVYCYLRRHGHGNEEAKDLTQGFFQEVVLGRELIQKADQSKGRFRTFLLTALNRYVINVHNRKAAAKRCPTGKIFQLDAIDVEAEPIANSDITPQEGFQYAWVAGVLDEILAEVKAECVEADKEVHWKVFGERVLNPILHNTAPPSMPEICTKHCIESETKASNMIVTVKRRLRKALDRSFEQSVESGLESNEELLELMAFFSRDGAR